MMGHLLLDKMEKMPEERMVIKTPKYKKNPLVYRDPNETPPGEWTQREIDALLNGVQKYDKGQWVRIKCDVQFRAALCNRTTMAMASKYLQLAKRRENQIKRELKRKQKEREKQERKLLPRKKNRHREAWTSEEDSALMSFVEEYGQKWEKIRSENVILEPPPINPNRTRGALCNRYQYLMNATQVNENEDSCEQEDEVSKEGDDDNRSFQSNCWNDREDRFLFQYAIKFNQDWVKVEEALFAKIRVMKTAAECSKRYEELMDGS